MPEVSARLMGNEDQGQTFGSYSDGWSSKALRKPYIMWIGRLGRLEGWRRVATY